MKLEPADAGIAFDGGASLAIYNDFRLSNDRGADPPGLVDSVLA